MLFHDKIIQNHFFPVSLHHKVMDITAVKGQNGGKVGLDLDFLAIQLQDPVADLQTALAV